MIQKVNKGDINMFKSKVEKHIEEQINELQMYLENNYKDLAIQARKDAVMLLEEYHQQGKLKDKAYSKYKDILNDYTKEMEHYNHQQFYRS